MTARLDHVALTVADRERSAAFYARYFGLVDRVHDDDHILIVSNAAGSLLAMSAGPPPPDLPRTTHFGFRLDGAGEVEDLRQRFRRDGVAECEWQERGPTRIQVLDPDGYRVEAYAF